MAARTATDSTIAAAVGRQGRALKDKARQTVMNLNLPANN